MMRAHRIEPVENSHERRGHDTHKTGVKPWLLVDERDQDNPLMVEGCRLGLEARMLAAYVKQQRGEKLTDDDPGMARIVAECYPGCTFEHIKTHERVTVE